MRLRRYFHKTTARSNWGAFVKLDLRDWVFGGQLGMFFGTVFMVFISIGIGPLTIDLEYERYGKCVRP